MKAKHSQINGDSEPLQIDRAIGELRRGRALRIRTQSASPMLAAVETLQADLLGRLEASAERLLLFLTGERGRAAGLSGNADEPIILSLENRVDLSAVRRLAGLDGSDSGAESAVKAENSKDAVRLAQAAFKLAKAGRLLPALLAIETGEGTIDDSVLEISMTSIEEHADLFGRDLKLAGRSRVPLAGSIDSEISLFRDEHGLSEHVAVVIGKPNLDETLPVRLHSACLTGDVLGSLRCDCGEQLKAAVARIAELGGGVLLYLDQEGRGIGLANKLRAYEIQSTGVDTYDANRHLGFDADERNFGIAAELLQALGVTRIQLLTNNPRKISSLKEHGIDVVGRIPLITPTNLHNERYIEAKRRRAGHMAEESSS